MPQNPTIGYIDILIKRIISIQLEVIDAGGELGNLTLEAKKRLSSILQDTIDILENEKLLEELNGNPWTKKS